MLGVRRDTDALERDDKMRQRMRFVLDAEEELFTMTELCQRYGISRELGATVLQPRDPGRSCGPEIR